MSQITITPLGTISPYEKENMNCPGFFIEYQDFKILLDCGNGITRLLHFPKDLENLHVFLSHFHDDHIGDIGSIQYASFCHHNLGGLQEKVKIYMPEQDFRFHRASILANQECFAEYFDINSSLSYQLGDLRVCFSDNHSHTIPSFMIKLETPDFKVVYTSDIGSTNMDGVVAFSKNSDILICESSFLKAHHSNSTTHMTASKAGEIARLASVKKLLLTHFWPEEDKSLYLDEAKELFPNTEVAIEGKQFILKK